MLQIIGWLGCLYLFVKGLEIIGNRASYLESGILAPSSLAAALGAIVGSVAFALALANQGSAMNETPMPQDASEAAFGDISPSKIDCINEADTTDEVLAC